MHGVAALESNSIRDDMIERMMEDTASHSQQPQHPNLDSSSSSKIAATLNNNSPFNGNYASWCALMLADSGLPTGSFVHSAGIQSASQLGFFSTSSDSDIEIIPICCTSYHTLCVMRACTFFIVV